MTNTTIKPKRERHPRNRAVIIIFMFCLAIGVGSLDELNKLISSTFTNVELDEKTNTVTSHIRPNTINNERDPMKEIYENTYPASSSAENKSDTMNETHDENITKMVADDSKKESEKLQKALDAKEKVVSRVKMDYGKYFDLFFTSEALSKMIQLSDKSYQRLVNIMLVKIVSAHLDESKSKTKFVWTTGGHSAAAGHGNLFSQSYTSVLDDTATEVFESLDIQMEGRNHAMGGYGSAPELASCMEAIFGADSDVLSWDFGMTDGRDTQNMIHWANRAGLLGGKDVDDENDDAVNTFLFFMNGAKGGKPQSEFSQFEGQDLGLGWLNTDVKQEIMQKLPDYKNWDVDKEDEETPMAVKYFMCGGWQESNESPCKDHKWNTSVCETANFQTSWHPGYKSHMLTGLIVGFFLIDVLIDALRVLEGQISESSSLTNFEVTPGYTKEFLHYLKLKEKSYGASFRSSFIPRKTFGIHYSENAINNTYFYRGHSYCRTALLPSVSRYETLHSPTSKDDKVEIVGYSASNLPPPKKKNETSPLLLVYDPYKIQKCDTLLNIDYKDYFLARPEDGLVSTKIPIDLDLEREQQNKQWEDRVGMFMLCQPNCPWGKCLKGALQLSSMSGEDINTNVTDTNIQSNMTDTVLQSNLTISIDGEKVQRTWQISEFCYVLENSEGNLIWGKGKSDNGQYELSVEVHLPTSFLQISSIVVW